MTAVQAFKEAVSAVSPFRCVQQVLSLRPDVLQISLPSSSTSFPLKSDSKVAVIAFGKASLAMTAAAELVLGDRFHKGAVLAPIGSVSEYELKSRIFYGAKDNLPDEDSISGTSHLISLISECDQSNNIILFLISGGGSALFCSPNGVTLEEKLIAIRALVSHGATIQQLNTIRQRLSKVKGGKTLALINKAQVISFLMSDIINDPAQLIASGPTVLPKEADDPLEVIKSLQIPLASLPESVVKRLLIQEKILFLSTERHFIVANNILALEVAKKFLENEGYSAHIVSSTLTGDAAERGKQFAHLLACNRAELAAVLNEIVPDYRLIDSSQRIALVFGGETTTINRIGSGKGGRCQHMALQCLYNLKKRTPAIHKFAFLAAGTDGQDGPTNAAGVIFSENDLNMAELSKMKKHLADFDSFSFWNSYNNRTNLIVSGKTGTNVMDLCLVMLDYS